MKLPAPAAFRFNYDGYGWDYRDNGSGSSWKVMGSAAPDKEFMFTESQMRQAIRDALEAAAKVCEETDTVMHTYCGKVYDSAPETLSNAIDAIRNLKEQVE
jgi:hypothetical protein